MGNVEVRIPPAALGRAMQIREVIARAKSGEISWLEAERANRYLRDVCIPSHNAGFGRSPRDAESAFVSCGAVDLEQILCIEEPRVVGKDDRAPSGGPRISDDFARMERNVAAMESRVESGAQQQPAWGLAVGGESPATARSERIPRFSATMIAVAGCCDPVGFLSVETLR